ncbi:MAG TPA: TfoX/Sxy family protein [Longimicrobium sp.]
MKSAIAEVTAERVRQVLRDPGVTGGRGTVERRIIGGLGFLVEDRLCCGAMGKGLLVRVGPEALDEALAEPHVQPMAFGTRQLEGYVLVAPEGYRTDAALSAWIRRGVAYASASR